MSYTRRDALKALATLAGAGAASRLLSACGGGGGPGQISTMVFLMMENRSYDHFLGARTLVEGKPGDGLAASMSNPDKDGNTIAIYPATTDPSAQCASSPPHSWSASRTQYAGGTNSGFVQAYNGNVPMGYMSRAELPVLNALADNYTTCDRWFSSLLGPTLPNRMYWHAAQSNGAMANADVIAGAFKGIKTIYHRLNDAGIPWAYYYGDAPVIGLIDGTDLTGKLRRFVPDFLDDALSGNLPPVVYIDPSFTYNDDHPPHHPLLGEQLISAIYTGLAQSPQWNECLFVIAYDEAGGFFDHVVPGTAPDDRAADGFDQLGFRIPGFVIGPYAKKGYVSSVVRDHTSALKHIETVHGLAPLTMRDAAATDLTECLDLARLAAGDPAAPIVLPEVVLDQTMLPASCNGGSSISRPFDHDILEWVDDNSAQLGELDRRKYAESDMYAIADWLDARGLGKIRRGR